MSNAAQGVECDPAQSRILAMACALTAKTRRGEFFEAIHRLLPLRETLLPSMSTSGGQDNGHGIRMSRFEQTSTTDCIQTIYDTVPREYSGVACRAAVVRTLTLCEHWATKVQPRGCASPSKLKPVLGMMRASLDSRPGVDEAAQTMERAEALVNRYIEALSNDSAVAAVATKGTRRIRQAKDRTQMADQFSDIDIVVIKTNGVHDHLPLVQTLSTLANDPPLCISWRSNSDLSFVYEKPFLKVDIDILGIAEFRSQGVNVDIRWARNGSVCAQACASETSVAGSRMLHQISDYKRRMSELAALSDGAIRSGSYLKATVLLDRIRVEVLGPLSAIHCGRPPRGVRRIEAWGGGYVSRLAPSVTAPSSVGCHIALESALHSFEELSRNLSIGIQAARDDGRKKLECDNILGRGLL